MIRFVLLAFILLPTLTYAAVTSTYEGKVTRCHIEGNVAFIYMESVIPGADVDCPGVRVWLDMQSYVGRAQYSTALSALVSGKNISIRANPGASKIFGACALYDISISQ